MEEIGLESLSLTGEAAQERKAARWRKLAMDVEGAFNQDDEKALWGVLLPLVRAQGFKAYKQSWSLLPLEEVEAEMWAEVAKCVCEYDGQEPFLLYRIMRRFNCRRPNIVRYVRCRRPFLDVASLDVAKEDRGEEVVDPAPGPDVLCQQRDLLNLVMALPELERSVVVLTANGYSLRQIAMRLWPEENKHPQTVKRMLDSARKRLLSA